MTDVMVTVALPWVNDEDELVYASMKFVGPRVDRRMAMRKMRKWYKLFTGRSQHKALLTAIWNNRHTTRVLSENEIAQKFHRMAIETYNKSSDTYAEEEAATGAE